MTKCTWLLVLSAVLVCADAQRSAQCHSESPLSPDYTAVLSTANDDAFAELPGFTRSVYKPNYALVTAESRVWAPHPAWKDSLTAHVISRASGAHFNMYFAKMKAGGQIDCSYQHGHQTAAFGVHRFALVLTGSIRVQPSSCDPETKPVTLPANHYVSLHPGFSGSVTAGQGGAELVVYERRHAESGTASPGSAKDSSDLPPLGGSALIHGSVEDSPELDTGDEVFTLRKLLPSRPEFAFNIHVMDFQPGEHLIVKEVHYNQHGLVMLQGKGIYRLADDWFPVTTGDAIWMAPYVPQWFAALGNRPARYVLYKDTSFDPLDHTM